MSNNNNNNNNINAWSNEFFGWNSSLFWAAKSVCLHSSGDDREGRFLFQRLSMALQHYNAILLHESFVGVDDPDL